MNGGAGRPAVLLVVASSSGAGKTTLLVSLVPALLAAGLRVGAVKRTHHDVDLDVPGKDSERLRRAGAAPVAIRGPRTTTVIAPTAPGDDTESLAATLASFGPLDLVLVEGGRDLPRHARIEVVPPGGVPASDAACVVATVCANAEEARASGRTPAFARDDVAGVARCVVAWLRDATSAPAGRASSA